MRIDVWGLGYAGLVCAAGLAQRGHHVTGVDIDDARIARLAAGAAHVREPGLAALVAAMVAGGRLTATTPARRSSEPADATVLCLPTPPQADGSLDTRSLLDAALAVVARLRTATAVHAVIVRSTVPVHFTANTLRPLLEAHSGKRAGVEFALAMVPEFLREGHALADFDDPSLVVVGADDALSRETVRPLFARAQRATQDVSTGAAEFMKLANNAFHGLKIGFANEVARAAHAQGIDGHAILRLLCQDAQLNLSAAYLEPGFAFGGACLEKDIAALASLGPPDDVMLLAAIAASNRAHRDACVQAIRARPWRRLGLCGLTNNTGSDDLRNSPALALVEALEATPDTLWAYDPDIDRARAPWLHEQHGIALVADLPALQAEVDLIVNFRRQPLPATPGCPQLHFASYWQGVVFPGGAARK